MNSALINLALISGLLTFLTPCGFAMLPAYISYYLGRDEEVKSISQIRRVFMGLRFGVLAGLGIVTIFAFLGAAIIILGNTVKPLIPWFTILGAFFIITIGILMFTKKDFSFVLPDKLKVGATARPGKNFYSFGIIYGLAVMSCSLPIFLAVTLGAFSAEGVGGGLFVFSIYAGAAAFSMIIFSLLLSIIRESMLKWMNKIFPYLQKVSAVIIIISGIYLIYYQVTVNRAISIFNL